MTSPRVSDHPIDPLFTRRWSPRAFTGEPIPRETLSTVLEAARWAPSSFNSQPWRFIVGHRDTPAWAPIFDALGHYAGSVAMVDSIQFIPDVPGRDLVDGIKAAARKISADLGYRPRAASAG